MRFDSCYPLVAFIELFYLLECHAYVSRPIANWTEKYKSYLGLSPTGEIKETNLAGELLSLKTTTSPNYRQRNIVLRSQSKL